MTVDGNCASFLQSSKSFVSPLTSWEPYSSIFLQACWFRYSNGSKKGPQSAWKLLRRYVLPSSYFWSGGSFEAFSSALSNLALLAFLGAATGSPYIVFITRFRRMALGHKYIYIYIYRMRGNVRGRKFSRISRMTSHLRTFISRTFPVTAVYCYTMASYLTTYRVSGEDMSKMIEQFFKPVCSDGSSSSLVSFVLHPGLDEVELGQMDWWKSLSKDEDVEVKFPHEQHGLTGKPSNHSKACSPGCISKV